MKGLRSKVDSGELPPYRFVEINGLRLPSPEHAYTVRLPNLYTFYSFSNMESLHFRMNLLVHVYGSVAPLVRLWPAIFLGRAIVLEYDWSVWTSLPTESRHTCFIKEMFLSIEFKHVVV
jgi:hypothetical protein